MERKSDKKGSGPARKKPAPAPVKRAAPREEVREAAPRAPREKRAPKVASIPQVDLRNTLQRRHKMVGVVVSDKMNKTIVVKIDRQVKNAIYKKYLMKSNKFKAHDEKNQAKVGDIVQLVESRPLSKEKRWALQSILKKGIQVIEFDDTPAANAGGQA